MSYYYPVFLDVKGKSVLVVGGGHVAQRKIESLLQYGAKINIAANKLNSKLKSLVNENKIAFLGPEFKENHLEGVFFVIAATDDKKLNHAISERAHERGILVNTVDQPEDCSFIVPSVVNKGDLVIAISTSGKSPALARRIREKLEIEFARGYDLFLSLMGRLRSEVIAMGVPQEERNKIFFEVVDSNLLEELAEGRWEKAESILSKILPGELPVKEIIADTIRR